MIIISFIVNDELNKIKDGFQKSLFYVTQEVVHIEKEHWAYIITNSIIHKHGIRFSLQLNAAAYRDDLHRHYEL